jgi:hypothetical protein
MDSYEAPSDMVESTGPDRRNGASEQCAYYTVLTDHHTHDDGNTFVNCRAASGSSLTHEDVLTVMHVRRPSPISRMFAVVTGRDFMQNELLFLQTATQ